MFQVFFLISYRLRALKTLYFYFCKIINKNIFAKKFARNYEKKHNAWNIRQWDNETIIPSSQRPSILYQRERCWTLSCCCLAWKSMMLAYQLWTYTPYPFIAHDISCMFKVDMPTSSIPTQGSSSSKFDISVLTDQRAHMTKDMLNTEKQAKPTYWVRGSDNNFETYSLATS